MARKKKNVNNIVNWQTVGDWIDTEGYIYAGLRDKNYKECKVVITQKEKKPLDLIHAFLYNQGIRCGKVYWDPYGETNRLSCARREDAKRVVDNIEKYLMTEKKQVKKFREVCDGED